MLDNTHLNSHLLSLSEVAPPITDDELLKELTGV